MEVIITARPLCHRGENRIKIELSHKDWAAISKIKSIPGRKWSHTHRCWHVPFTEDALRQLKGCFGGQLDARQLEGVPGQTSAQACLAHAELQNPEPALLQASAPAQPESPFPAARIQPEFRTITQYGGARRIVVGNRLALLQSSPQWIAAFVPHDKKNWIEHIKSIPGRRWDAKQCCWLLPLTAESVHAVRDFFGELAVFGFAIPEELPESWRPPPSSKRPPQKKQLNERQRRAVSALEEQLILEGKRHRTIKSYKGILISLLLHYPKTEPEQVSLEQVKAYIVYKKKSADIATSTHNQIINALNAYFGRVLGQNEKVQKLPRPKKRRKLPNVLSEEEVQRLIQAVKNPKHKCMLLLIYSAGLRKGEVLNLRVRDLNPGRQCIFVKDSKGGKDRYTLYSPKAIRYVSEYIRTYKPRYWLFEGQTGGQYSESSLQALFGRAREESGVNPFITIHGLRHSFATHLVERGVSLHKVKQLLGHEHLKTTEVYLHLAQDFFQKVQSPLEGLDL
ncbi:MAG: tyrosine-type recombinase/integrase [Lewinellaceae bacterium]|nr:tyrosine-type recombinase/integrase [Lewinellaceae bacterium]